MPRPSAPNPAPHPIHARSLQSVIPRLRRRLVQDVGRRLAQPRPLAAEADVADARDVLVAVAEVVREEEHEAVHLGEERAPDGDLLHVRRLRELERLDGPGVLGGGEVEVVAVDVQVEGSWCRGRGGGAEEDGVEFDLGGEAVCIFV